MEKDYKDKDCYKEKSNDSGIYIRGMKECQEPTDINPRIVRFQEDFY